MPYTRKWLKDFIESNELNISHFDKTFAVRATRKHILIEKSCPQCQRLFQTCGTGKSSKKTCSIHCSNVFFASKRSTPESAAKISKALKKFRMGEQLEMTPPKINMCQNCKTVPTRTTKNKYCSNKCASAVNSVSLELRAKLSNIAKQRVLAGTHKGWNTRNIMSYPEKYFKMRLEESKLIFRVNYPVPKRQLGVQEASCYFLDFFFEDAKVDLEIDGKQHNIPERKLSDEKRDQLLIDAGFKVFRIKWKNPINDVNKKYIDNEFDRFLAFLALQNV